MTATKKNARASAREDAETFNIFLPNVGFFKQTIFGRLSLQGVSGFAVHRYADGDWRVSHVETGALCGAGDTAVQAIEGARREVKRVGKDGLMKSIDKAREVVSRWRAKASV